MPSPPSPCRLYVFLARDAPRAAVLRRGPSDWARLSLWHTDTDTVEHGQWIKCRVYERRSDISADGSLFAYFARGAPRASTEPGADSWLAVSRPPYFTALALWFVGTTYYTGGYFPERRSLWTGFGAAPPDEGRPPSWLSLKSELPPFIERGSEWTERTVFVNRLLRDGWRALPDAATATTWERPEPDGSRTLLMTERVDRASNAFGGRYVVEYAVCAPESDEIFPLGRATWADWDHAGRVVIAQNGRLLAWQSPDILHEIADFTMQRPDPAPSPGHARAWPRAPRR